LIDLWYLHLHRPVISALHQCTALWQSSQKISYSTVPIECRRHLVGVRRRNPKDQVRLHCHHGRSHHWRELLQVLIRGNHSHSLLTDFTEQSLETVIEGD
jgi:hypothetical protein